MSLGLWLYLQRLFAVTIQLIYNDILPVFKNFLTFIRNGMEVVGFYINCLSDVYNIWYYFGVVGGKGTSYEFHLQRKIVFERSLPSPTLPRDSCLHKGPVFSLISHLRHLRLLRSIALFRPEEEFLIFPPKIFSRVSKPSFPFGSRFRCPLGLFLRISNFRSFLRWVLFP